MSRLLSILLNHIRHLMLIGSLCLISVAHANAPDAKTINTLTRQGVPKRALKRAMTAYNNAESHHLLHNHLLTLVDFQLASNQIRLWILNPNTGKIVYRGHVAHGSGSGLAMATRFGDTANAHTSSLGAYVTKNVYVGKHGTSLRLAGLEPGVNDKVESRAIVLHGAPYMTDAFIKQYGRAGRSWGCFALNPTDTPGVISKIKDGSMIYAYAPQQDNDPQFQ